MISLLCPTLKLFGLKNRLHVKAFSNVYSMFNMCNIISEVIARHKNEFIPPIFSGVPLYFLTNFHLQERDQKYVFHISNDIHGFSLFPCRGYIYVPFIKDI